MRATWPLHVQRRQRAHDADLPDQHAIRAHGAIRGNGNIRTRRHKDRRTTCVQHTKAVVGDQIAIGIW